MIESLQKIYALLHKPALWLIRGALLWMILVSLRPAGPRATIGDDHTVETVQNHVCVHTRLVDEVEEWKIQRNLQMVREMGAETIVEFFPWAYFESSPGNYQWERPDMLMRHAKNQGLKVIARMGFVPDWARPEQDEQFTTLNSLDEQYYPDFARFVAAFADRYAGTIEQIIIWNEPNLAFEWGFEQVDPVAYVRLLETVYPLAKAANPDIEILAGALAPTLEPEDSPYGLNDLLYLEAMYENGAADYFDALAIHTYGFTLPPEDTPENDRLNFRRVELLRDIMEKYGDDAKPVYITESGWNDHPRWTQAVRPSERAIYTVEAFQMAEDWDWLNELCIWAFRYPIATHSYPDNFTLVTHDFQRKPIYYAIQAYAQQRERSDTLWLSPPVDSR
ncbi:MAG: hypothetical protein ACPG7F_16425 [Aggregatilineales bacterium]